MLDEARERINVTIANVTKRWRIRVTLRVNASLIAELCSVTISVSTIVTFPRPSVLVVTHLYE